LPARISCIQQATHATFASNCMVFSDTGLLWFTKCNVKGNGNGLPSITGGNKFE
jgi:hypothetical protein